MNTKLLTAVALFFFVFSLQAQEWKYDENGKELTNFYDIQKRAEELFAGRESEKGIGYKPYKRWEWYWESRVQADGTFFPVDYKRKEWERYARTHAITANAENANSYWTSVGPDHSDNGIGRINCIAFHPTDPNTLWVGAPSGGIWKSTDDGQSWEYLFKTQPNIGVSSILVHPTNPDIIYVITGDSDAGHTRFDGILKTTDGGQNWVRPAHVWNNFGYISVRELRMHPSNPNILFLVTSNGIHRSTDAAESWVNVAPSAGTFFYDIEFKPNDPNVMYAVSRTAVYKSTDNGVQWTHKFDVPTNGFRLTMAVSPDNPNYVYVLSVNTGFAGMWRSEDAGETFTRRNGAMNFGGQTGYNLVLAVDPNNAERVFTGAITMFQSMDGGNSWDYSDNNLHADKHALEWNPLQNTFYCGNDGGVYKLSYDGSYWNFISGNLVIGQIYKLGLSSLDSRILIGLQDNGTQIRKENDIWSQVIGADGMECFFSPHESDVFYGSVQNGGIRKTTTNGEYFNGIKPNGAGNGIWITPFNLVETSATSYALYCGYKDVYKSIDQGDSWAKLTNHSQNSNVRILSVAPSNPNYFYYYFSGNLYGTSDEGQTISQITTPIASISDIEIDPTDPLHVWIVSEGFANANVLESYDGGTTWTDISGSLPYVPTNCLVYQNNALESLYLGTDVGVFYRDNTMSDWAMFSTELPVVEITDLEIREAENMIYASTFGLGVWKSFLHTNNTNYLSVSPNTIQLNLLAGSDEIIVSSDVSWSISVPAWISMSQTTGNGNSTLSFDYQENTNSNNRIGEITVTGGGITEKVVLTQDGTNVPYPDIFLENPKMQVTDIYAGESPYCEIDIKNLGNAPVSDRFLVTAYVSKDATFSPDDLAYSTFRNYNTLPASGVFEKEYFPINFPESIPAGTYYLIFVADVTDIIAESNEHNNISNAIQFTILPNPEICVNGLLTNGGYEAGLSAWTGNGVLENNKVFEGNTAVKLCTDDSYAIQKIPIFPNKTYRFSVYLARDLGTIGYGEFQILNGGDAIIASAATSISDESYTRFTSIFETPSDAVFARVNLNKRTGTQCVYADNWCISEINPTTVCEINALSANRICNDNGTPNDDSDDVFSFDITSNQNGNCGTQWTAEGQSADYGSALSFGPYPLANGDKTILINDVQDPSVTQTLLVQQTSTCSNGGTTCQNTLLQNADFENGLNAWSGDAVLTTTRVNTGSAAAELCGNNQILRQTIAASPGEVYDVEVFALKENNSTYGVLSLKFLNSSWTPIDNKFKSITKTIFNGSAAFGVHNIFNATAPPNTAYVEVSIAKTSATGCIWVDDFCFNIDDGGGNCTLASAVSNIQCSDNGTANDPSDDTYSFDLNVSQSGNCGSNWTGDGQTGAYATSVTFGPYLIANGNKNFLVQDVNDPTATSIVSVLAPAPCSSGGGACSIEAEISNIVCDPPFVEYDLLVTGQNTATNFGYFVQLDPMDDLFQSSPYNVPVSVRQWVGMNPGTVQFSVFDLDRDTCKAFYSATCTGGGTCSFNLLQNADFTANGTDWNENLAQHINYISNTDAHDVTSVEICGTGARIYQTKQIQGGKTYTLQAQVKRTTTARGLLVIKYMNSSWIPVSQDFLTCETANYSLEMMELAAPTDATWAEVSFYHNGGSGCVYADDFCFSEKTGGGSCAITAEVTNIQCFAMGTPNDPSDDRFAASILVEKNSDCGTFWSNGNGTGSYGTVSFGNLLISDGDVTYIFHDVDNPSATVTVTAFAPAPCSGGGNQPDLTVENLNLASSSAQIGDVVNFNFDLKNIGNGGASADFTIKSYLSTDQTLSSDDVHDGTIPTGFISAGQTIPQTGGALTIPNGMANGQYWVLLKVDADEEIAESNEGNNVTVSVGQLTVSGGGNTPDLALSATASPLMPGQWKNTSITLTLQNTGTTAASGIEVITPASMNTAFRDKMAYVNHSTATGTYSEWLGKWNVGSLAAGATATLTYYGFTKVATPINFFSQVSAQSPTDADSAPNNNSSGTPVEDDEALATVNGSMPFTIGNEGKVAAEITVPVAILYPNPASSFLTLDLNDFKGKKVDIRLVDLFGRVVLERNATSSNFEIFDLTSVANGNYLMQLRSEDCRPISLKLMVEKAH